MRDITSQAPTAICELTPTPIAFNLMVNRDNPPFNDPDLRRAMMLTIDRKAFLDILLEGKGAIGGAMQPAPEGLWGLPPEIQQTLPGYGPDVEKSRAEARQNDARSSGSRSVDHAERWQRRAANDQCCRQTCRHDDRTGA